MSQAHYRGNLQNMTFPMLSKLASKTVIDPQADNTYTKGVSTDGNVPPDIGIPYMVYGHNVMPSTYGWQSVMFDNIFAAPDPAATFDEMHLVYATRGGQEPKPTGFRSYVALGTKAGGERALYVVDTEFFNWREITEGQPVGINEDTFITTANVNGVTWIYFSEIGAFLYDDTIDELLPREFLGLDTENVLGISSSNGYMFAVTADAVAWSSVVDVEDFQPSDTSGAGGGSLQEAKGRIVCIRPTVYGFLIFTEGNTVSATYSGNEDFPWNFKGVAGSGGVASRKNASVSQIGDWHYMYSTNGLQRVNHIKCDTIMPMVTDFLSGKTFEDFDSTSNTFTQYEITWSMPKQLSVAADRYIILSYGRLPGQAFTHAIVVDLLQARMGKLKVTHTFAFERVNITEEVIELPRSCLGFLTSTGLCKVLEFGFDDVSLDSVLILGKYQLQREYLIEAHEVEFENLKNDGNFACLLYKSLDGKNLGTPVAGTLLSSGTDTRTYGFDGAIGKNLALLVKGTFNLISYVMRFTNDGRE